MILFLSYTEEIPDIHISVYSLVITMSFASNTESVSDEVEGIWFSPVSLKDETQPPIRCRAARAWQQRRRRNPFPARNWGWVGWKCLDCYPAPPTDWLESSSDCDWFDWLWSCWAILALQCIFGRWKSNFFLLLCGKKKYTHDFT